MKKGNLVRVKDCLGYGAYMQNLVGHIGVVIEVNCKAHPQSTMLCTKVFIQEKIRYVFPQDLEIVNEGR